MLLAAVGGVLLIVCVNLGNLMLVRSERRTREAAIRRALGATTARLVRQSLREGLLLSALGGAASLLFAYWAVAGLVAIAPPDTPRLGEVRIEVYALSFAFGVTAAAGLLTSVVPAFRFSRGALTGGLRESQATVSGSSGRVRARGLLVATEVALSAALLVVAGLVGAGFFRLMSVDRGFVTENVLSFDLVLQQQQYPLKGGSRGRFHEKLIQRLEELPSVRATGLTSKLPLEGST